MSRKRVRYRESSLSIRSAGGLPLGGWAKRVVLFPLCLKSLANYTWSLLYRLLIVLAVLCAGGCLKLDVSRCASGLTCAATQVCVEDSAGDRCVDESDYYQCLGREDDTICATGSIEGRCRNGLCFSGCGDALLQLDLGEECDGDLVISSCQQEGFYEGTLGCDVSTCTFDLSNCSGFCGDGVLNLTEICDPGFLENTCGYIGFDRGASVCPDCVPDTSDCSTVGWTTLATPLSSAYAIASAGQGYLYVVGDRRIAAWNGLIWRTEYGAAEDLLAIDMADTTFGFAAGFNTLYERTSTGWNPRPIPGQVAVTSLWAAAPRHAFVGATGRLRSFKDGQWQEIPFPAEHASAFAVSVTGRGPDDVYVATGLSSTVLLHYDGVAWTTAAEFEGYVSEIIAREDSLLLGGSSVWELKDGAEVPSEILDRAISAMALHGDILYLADVAQVTRCVLGDVPSCGPGEPLKDQRLDDIAALGPWQVYAATPEGVARFDGIAREVSNPYTFGGAPILDVHAVAHRQYVAGSKDGILSGWSDSRDSIICHPQPGFENCLNGESANAVWTAEDGWILVGTGGGTIRYFDGVDWTVEQPALPYTFTDIYGFGPAAIAVANGNDGSFAAFHRDGTNWISTAMSTEMTAVWMGEDSTGYAVGRGGSIQQFSDGTWAAMTSPATLDLRGVSGIAPSDVTAVGDGGTVLHFDGVAWSVLSFPSAENLRGVGGGFVSTEDGDAYHLTDGEWEPVSTAWLNGPVEQISTFRHGAVLRSDHHVASLRPYVPWGACGANEGGLCDNFIDDDCDGYVDAADSDCP